MSTVLLGQLAAALVLQNGLSSFVDYLTTGEV